MKIFNALTFSDPTELKFKALVFYFVMYNVDTTREADIVDIYI